MNEKKTKLDEIEKPITAPEDTLVVDKVDETETDITVKLPDGDTAVIDKASIVQETTNDDLISKTKVLEIVNDVVSKYDGKVVLAMSEVRDIVKAVTTAINE